MAPQELPGTPGQTTLVTALSVTVPSSGSEKPQDASGPLSFGEWFWSPVQQPTAVLRIVDAFRRRDEDAVIELAQHLCPHRCRDIEHLRVDLGNPRWTNIIQTPSRLLKCICFVGRPALFGDDVLSAMNKPETTFVFPRDKRPKGLNSGDIDADYHRIIERSPSGEELRSHQAALHNSVHTDYGLVQ